MTPRLPLLFCAALLTATAADTQTGTPLPDTEMVKRMDARAAHYGDLSRAIWELAEVGYQEQHSAALLQKELRAAGFRIEEGIGGMPTSFVASWGEGGPVIGIMGEYDALPGLSQEPVAERRVREGITAGHGCGHNLLGVASAFAAITVKEFLAARKLPGTIKFFGTPAEEGGNGKVYMIRAGAFAGVDVVLHWHPSDRNEAALESTTANITAKFRFRGVAAHAASAPDKGRSALDAVMVMTHAVDLLREHVPQETRLHYILTEGGAAPNIVPDVAEVYLYARHPEMPVLDGIWERVVKCAEAGALATGTTMEVELVASVYNHLSNDVLTAIIDRNLRGVGGVAYAADEQAFAEAVRKTYSLAGARPLGSERAIQTPRPGAASGSTDAADVSWVVPTGWLWAATYVPGTPAHTWQATACAGSSIGRKGMLVAAKTLALTATELFLSKTDIAAAKASFEKQRAGREYRSRIPADRKPPLDYRDK
jgi:aminobenzoyl-glutamate utilization protein B